LSWMRPGVVCNRTPPRSTGALAAGGRSPVEPLHEPVRPATAPPVVYVKVHARPGIRHSSFAIRHFPMSVYRPLHDRGVMARWREYLPVTDATPFISLNEGSTPLIHSPKLSARVGRGSEVFIKYEGLNPTGSFKDRGMTMALSKAVEDGARAVICASTGNTSAAAAAYAARAGISCIVLLPAGKIAFGKLAQAFMYGARVVAIDGNFDDALNLVREIGETEPIAIVNSINPYRLQGQKTGAFEVAAVYAGLGDNDQAFVWLDKSFDDRSLSFENMIPLEGLRADPRFDRFRQRLSGQNR